MSNKHFFLFSFFVFFSFLSLLSFFLIRVPNEPLTNSVEQNHSCYASLSVTPDQSCRDIAQAVSRRRPIAAVRVRAQIRSCGICGGQSGIGESFLRVLRFPLSIIHTYHPSSQAGSIGQLVADVPSGLSLTPPQVTKKH
jgi:hypothetical protein